MYSFTHVEPSWCTLPIAQFGPDDSTHLDAHTYSTLIGYLCVQQNTVNTLVSYSLVHSNSLYSVHVSHNAMHLRSFTVEII